MARKSTKVFELNNVCVILIPVSDRKLMWLKVVCTVFREPFFSPTKIYISFKNPETIQKENGSFIFIP